MNSVSFVSLYCIHAQKLSTSSFWEKKLVNCSKLKSCKECATSRILPPIHHTHHTTHQKFYASIYHSNPRTKKNSISRFSSSNKKTSFLFSQKKQKNTRKVSPPFFYHFENDLNKM